MSIKIVDLNKTYKIIKKKLNLRIDKVLNSQKFILGEEVDKLEKNLSKYLNVKYSLGVSSGTDALILALMAWMLERRWGYRSWYDLDIIWVA